MTDPGTKPAILKSRLDPSTDEEIIRVRAYQYYEQRGREEGHDLQDWLRAEEEFRQKTQKIQKSRSAAA